jgi:hypothetical protein
MSSGDLAPAAAKPAKLQPPAYRFQKKIGGVMASRSPLPKPAMVDSPGPTPSLVPKVAKTPAPAPLPAAASVLVTSFSSGQRPTPLEPLSAGTQF